MCETVDRLVTNFVTNVSAGSNYDRLHTKKP